MKGKLWHGWALGPAERRASTVGERVFGGEKILPYGTELPRPRQSCAAASLPTGALQAARRMLPCSRCRERLLKRPKLALKSPGVGGDFFFVRCYFQ